MIHLLTIILMILIPWSIYSLVIVVDDDEFMVCSGDELILKIAKIYWGIIFISLALGLLWAFSHAISEDIICGVTNDDYAVCEKVSDKE